MYEPIYALMTLKGEAKQSKKGALRRQKLKV